MSTQQTPQTLQKLFIQMSGAPGSGKSTMARLLARFINNTVVIDHDILRSSFLESNMAFEHAANCAYQFQWKLAQDFIEQGLNVIIDSTCNFQTVLDQGSTLAKKHGYSFWYVECRVQDVDLLDERLRTRTPMTSQRAGVYRPPAAAEKGNCTVAEFHALFEKWIERPCRPESNLVIVDSTGDAEILRDHILKQIVG